MAFSGAPDEVVLPSCLPMPRAGCCCGVHGVRVPHPTAPGPAVQFQEGRNPSAISSPAPPCGVASVELAIVKWNLVRFLSCTFC